MEEIANHFGYRYHGRVGKLPNYYLISTPKNSEEVHYIQKRLDSHEQIEWVEHQIPEQRLYKRDLIGDIRTKFDLKDPGFSNQWHLVNPEFTGNDLNVVGAWESGVTGTGVTVAFIDDGIDHENEDLRDNFSLKGSWDFNFDKNLPTPSLPDDIHGTRCAGEVGAVKNNVCGVGVAYNAKVAGVRLLSGKITNYDQAAAVNYAWDINQIYSCSWGPLDDGRTMESPSKMVSDAFKNGALSGRSGLGSIYVFAAGNGGFHHDNCNFDGYTNSIYTITISAMDKRQNHPTYSEQCPAILMTAYSSSNGNSDGIYTSDWRTGCTQSHGGSDVLIKGTSAAAPLASGIYALVLSASWRDIQRLSIETAVIVDKNDNDWIKNGAGRLYNHKYGYGGFDAAKIVEAAKTFKKVGLHTEIRKENLNLDINIPDGDRNGLQNTIQITQQDIDAAKLYRLEHVTISVTIIHPRRGDIHVHLISPSNFVSRMIESRSGDSASTGFNDWKMMSVAFWDEPVLGNWTIKVLDLDFPQQNGKLVGWKLSLFGEQFNETIISNQPTPTGIPTNTDLPAYDEMKNGNGLAIFFIASIGFVILFASAFYWYQKRRSQRGRFDDYSEFERLAAFEEGDFDAIALDDLDLPRTELLFDGRQIEDQ